MERSRENGEEKARKESAKGGEAGSFSTDIASPRKNLEGRFFTLNEAAKLILMNVKLPSFYVPSCRKEKEKLEPPLSRANSTPNDFLQADADFNRRFSPRFFDPFPRSFLSNLLRSLISRYWAREEEV